jgi:murein DD-endopeptidase MepM/ murein hydrolase activator NlpD
MSGLKAAQSQRVVARYAGPVVEPRGRGAARPVPAGAGYTIAHAGRQIRLGPVAFWIFVGTTVVMAGWSVATATYFAFHDDLLKGLLARQAEQQYAYEDRIAELRARIDRATSRQLLDQEQFAQKLEDLLRRQAALESRGAALAGFADPTATGSIRPQAGGRLPIDGHAAPGRERHSSLDLDQAPRGSGRVADAGARLAQVERGQVERGQVEHSQVERGQIDLAQIEAALDRIDRHQAAALADMQARYEERARKVRSVLAEVGLRPSSPAASGGPFVPIKLPGEGGGFERALTRVTIARAQTEQLNRTLIFVPVRKPVTGDIDLSSTFGVRIDPFLHIPAMHTGVDFRGDTGEPIHATAAGTVTGAGWSGGYGKMVEVDHGNGLSTRYGHLSEIDVKVGDSIRIGEVVGRMGSTGRSTGPHLHYETRVDGEAVDPQRFLNAGAHLGGGM